MTALESIWVVGDMAMSILTPKFNQIRSRQIEDKNPGYIDHNYDIKFIFTPLDSHKNILVRIFNAFVAMLNQSIRLPRFLIILLDNDFAKLTGGYANTEYAIAWIMGNFTAKIGDRKRTYWIRPIGLASPYLYSWNQDRNQQIMGQIGEVAKTRSEFLTDHWKL